jgi:ABC-type sugar transport system ATPase subunit
MAGFLQMRNISKSYGGTMALRDVNFSADTGETHAISGENGAGKSTLIKILSGAVQPDDGEIWLTTSALTGSPSDAHLLGITPSTRSQPGSHLSITENILLGHAPSSALSWWVDWATAHRQARALLEETASLASMSGCRFRV